MRGSTCAYAILCRVRNEFRPTQSQNGFRPPFVTLVPTKSTKGGRETASFGLLLTVLGPCNCISIAAIRGVFYWLCVGVYSYKIVRLGVLSMLSHSCVHERAAHACGRVQEPVEPCIAAASIFQSILFTNSKQPQLMRKAQDHRKPTQLRAFKVKYFGALAFPEQPVDRAAPDKLLLKAGHVTSCPNSPTKVCTMHQLQKLPQMGDIRNTCKLAAQALAKAHGMIQVISCRARATESRDAAMHRPCHYSSKVHQLLRAALTSMLHENLILRAPDKSSSLALGACLF